MSDDDPVYQHRRTIKESIEHLKKMIETMPKMAIAADWERVVGTQRVRHKPSGSFLNGFGRSKISRGRESKMLVLNLLDFPEDIGPHE